MGIFEINIAREKLTQLPSGTVLGLENRDSLNFLAVGFSNFVSDFSNSFLSSSLIAPMVTDYLFNSAMKKLEKVPYTSLDKFTIRTPEGVTGEMLPYLDVLSAVTNDMVTIKERLLDPLKMWTAKAISNPGFIEKVWFDRNLAFIDVDKHLEALAGHYDNKVGDDLSFKPITDVYPRSIDFKQSGDVLKDLTKKSAIIMGYDVPKVSSDIASCVKRLIDENDKKDFMQQAPTQAIARLSESLYAAAREIELLSIVLFQIKIAATAYEESAQKISEKL